MTARFVVQNLSVTGRAGGGPDAIGLALEAGGVALLADGGLALRAIAGLAPSAAQVGGEIRVDGKTISGEEAIRDGRMAFVPWDADRACVSHLSLGELMAEAAPAPDSARVRAALAAVGLAPSSLDLNLGRSNAATRWRAALALALAGDPVVLLLESPGSGLDATARGALLARLAAWARAENRVLVVSGPEGKGLSGLADVIVPQDDQPHDVADPVAGLAVRADPQDDAPAALVVRDLSIAVPLGRSLIGGARWLTVVKGIGFDIDEGGSVALLGESGSGKSMVARAVVRFARSVGGCITWKGHNLVTCDQTTLRSVRGDIQFLPSDPADGLDPLRTVGAQIEDPIKLLRRNIPKSERKALVIESLRRAGLSPEDAARYPGDLTPLEAARAGLARALSVGPKLLVCDDPLDRLDAPAAERMAEQLLALGEAGLGLLVATANARTALRLAHRTLVLAGGRIVEDAPSSVLASEARHPLTRALLSVARGIPVELDLGSNTNGRGCPLRPRCPRNRPACAGQTPALERIGPSHLVACNGWDESEPQD